MRRREFIAGLGSAAAWPLAARAQQAAMPVVGFLNLGSARQNARYVAEFLQNLEKAGYVEGKNVAIEYRWGDGQPARLAELAADLVSRQVAVIVAIDTPSIRAAKAVSTTIPIVFLLVGDPVKDGFVASLNRPGGNMTGVSTLSTELLTKRLDWLRKIVPKAMTVAYLTTPVPGSPTAEEETSEVLAAAGALGQQVIVVEVRNVSDIDAAFMTLSQGEADALLLPNRVMFASNRDKLLALAARHRIPTCYFDRIWVSRGGLMSYSADPVPLRPVIADYVARILKGTKPTDLPVQQPTKFDLVINLKTAKALGITIPETLLAIANEVIQ
jgi:putative tryptophan/tyrosine transport system substrate-binding protein